jgi:hypothetical protein
VSKESLVLARKSFKKAEPRMLAIGDFLEWVSVVKNYFSSPVQYLARCPALTPVR